MYKKISKYTFIFQLLLLVTNCISCKYAKRLEAEKIVNEWIGKKLIFPKDINCNFLGKDTVCPIMEVGVPYKIFIFTDSVGCTGCQLQTSKWNHLIAEIDSVSPSKVLFSSTQ